MVECDDDPDPQAKLVDLMLTTCQSRRRTVVNGRKLDEDSLRHLTQAKSDEFFR